MSTSIDSKPTNLIAKIKRAVSELKGKEGSRTSLFVDGSGRLHVSDAQILNVIEALGGITLTNVALQTLIEGIKISNSVKVQTKVVSCPKYPAVILGSDTGVALESGDTMGNVFAIDVPTSGVIYSATLFDFDYKNIQTDLEIFKAPIADVAVDAAYAPSDGEGLTFLTELAFFAFDAQGANFYTSELTNIGKAYSAPNGKFYIQAVTRGTPTVTAGSPYRVQIQILSDDPDWQER